VRPASAALREGRIVLELTQTQVDQVVRVASDGGVVSALLGGLGDLRKALARGQEPGAFSPLDDRRFSHTLLTGLLVLAALPADGSACGLAEIGQATGLSSSSAHRYIATLVAASLIKRDPGTRKYRLVAGASAHVRTARAPAS